MMHRTRSRNLLCVLVVVLAGAGIAGCSLYRNSDDDDPAAALDGGAVSDATPSTCQTSEDDAVAALRRCMQLDAWQQAGLCDLSSMVTSQGPCYTCHARGMGGTELDQDCGKTFEAMKTWPEQNDLVRAVTGDDGCFTGFQVGRICGEGLPDSHPPFRCPNAIAAALGDYIASTSQSAADGTCPIGP